MLFNVNGMFGNRVPIINNNVRMQDQEWGTEHAPNFDINAAGKITVIKGASGLQYGGDAGGSDSDYFEAGFQDDEDSAIRSFHSFNLL